MNPTNLLAEAVAAERDRAIRRSVTQHLFTRAIRCCRESRLARFTGRLARRPPAPSNAACCV